MAKNHLKKEKLSKSEKLSLISRSKIFCMCEGGSESAIMNLLLETDSLVFRKSDLLPDNEVIRRVPSIKFVNKYLQVDFEGDEIVLLRIIDSRNENFQIKEPYNKQITVIDIITAPEIEILLIEAENQISQYKRSKLKPSEFCKQYFQTSKIKKN